MISGHDFAYATTAQLSGHAENCDLMGSLELRLQHGSLNFNYELIHSSWKRSLGLLTIISKEPRKRILDDTVCLKSLPHYHAISYQNWTITEPMLAASGHVCLTSGMLLDVYRMARVQYHYNNATMGVLASQSPASRLRHWSLCGEFTGDRWIRRTNGQ